MSSETSLVFVPNTPSEKTPALQFPIQESRKWNVKPLCLTWRNNVGSVGLLVTANCVGSLPAAFKLWALSSIKAFVRVPPPELSVRAADHGDMSKSIRSRANFEELSFLLPPSFWRKTFKLGTRWDCMQFCQFLEFWSGGVLIANEKRRPVLIYGFL